MQSDYLWIRNAPVEEGLKVRYIVSKKEITDISTCTIAHPMPPRDSSLSTGIFDLSSDPWESNMIGNWKSTD